MLEESVEILLVEDNPNDLKLTLHALKKNNLANKIKIARDGAEALDFIFHKCKESLHNIYPRVILLDLKLPKVDGLEVLRQIKSDKKTKLIPVVVLTSSQEEKDIITSYQLGANSYVAKPVDFEKFVKSVKYILHIS